MRRVLVILFALISAVWAREMFLVEFFDDFEYVADITEVDTAASITFALESPAFVLVTCSGVFSQTGIPNENGNTGSAWMEIDGDSLSHTTQYMFSTNPPKIYYNVSLVQDMEPGEHTMEILFAAPRFDFNGRYKRMRLQALIFQEEDTVQAITEYPEDNHGIANQRSILTSGNYVRVEGCDAIRDVSGRVLDITIENDKLSISTLPAGTYFAETSTGTIKIVKMQ